MQTVWQNKVLEKKKRRNNKDVSTEPTYCLWKSFSLLPIHSRDPLQCVNLPTLDVPGMVFRLVPAPPNVLKCGNWLTWRSQASFFMITMKGRLWFSFPPTPVHFTPSELFPREEPIAFCPKRWSPYTEPVGFPEVFEKKYLGSEPDSPFTDGNSVLDCLRLPTPSGGPAEALWFQESEHLTLSGYLSPWPTEKFNGSVLKEWCQVSLKVWVLPTDHFVRPLICSYWGNCG